MIAKLSGAAALTAAIALVNFAAIAGAGDYTFDPVAPEMKKGDDVTVAVRLTDRRTMAPDGMAEMESVVTPLPSKEPGIYAFKTDMPMAGRYQITLSAKVQGEPETVVGNVIVTATK